MKFLNNLFGLAVIGGIIFIGYQVINSSNAKGVGQGQGMGTSYDEAVSQALVAHKPIVLIFSATWCPPCKILEQEVIPSPEVQRHQNEFIWLRLDVDQAPSKPLVRRFPGRYVPQIVVLSSDGQRKLGEKFGPSEPSDFAAFLLDALVKN
jgi:thiol:disulfide interchange protein